MGEKRIGFVLNIYFILDSVWYFVLIVYIGVTSAGVVEHLTLTLKKKLSVMQVYSISAM